MDLNVPFFQHKNKLFYPLVYGAKSGQLWSFERKIFDGILKIASKILSFNII